MHKIQNVIGALEEKMVQENTGENTVLSVEEKDLVTRSSIPILKLISLNVALKGYGVQHMVDDYAEAIAFDYVLGYADSLFTLVVGGPLSTRFLS